MLYFVVCLGKGVSTTSDVRIHELSSCQPLGARHAD